MNFFRRLISIQLAVLMLSGCFMPALADSLEDSSLELPETALIEDNLELAEAEETEIEIETEEIKKEDTAEGLSEDFISEPESYILNENEEVTENLNSDGESIDNTPENSLEETSEEPEFSPYGNSSLNILSKGTMLSDGLSFYYCENDCLYYAYDMEESYMLLQDVCGGLNLVGNTLYYLNTYGNVFSYDFESEEIQMVYEGNVSCLYASDKTLWFIENEQVLAFDLENRNTYTYEDSPAELYGFIPTLYGIIYISGSKFDSTIFINGHAVLYSVSSVYEDSGYLVFTDECTCQVCLEELFAENYIYSPLIEEFDLHEGEYEMPILSEEEQIANEVEYLQSEEYEKILALTDDNYITESPEENGDTDDISADQSEEPAGGNNLSVKYCRKCTSQKVLRGSIVTTAQQNGTMTDDQWAIIKRAKQISEVLWTPIKNIYAWGGEDNYYTVRAEDGTESNMFLAGKTYKGIPYSWAVSTSDHPKAGYVGWDLSVSDFINAVNDSESLFNTKYSYYGETAPYYGSDCSGFVSWAWDLNYRQTCSSLDSGAYRKVIGTDLNSIQVGDCLNNVNSHVILVTDIGYDADGNIVSVEITEETLPKMKVTCYGQTIPGKNYTYSNSNLYYLQTYYLNQGYVIYRRAYSGKTPTYESDPAVPLEEDGWIKAPEISINVDPESQKIKVELSGENTVYYTTDGSVASTNSTIYTGAFMVTNGTVVHAIVDPEGYSGAFQLVYCVNVKECGIPELKLVSGKIDGMTVASGSYITLSSTNADTIYYTLDGSTPTTSSLKMPAEGIKITSGLTIKARAVGDSALASSIVQYTIKTGTFYSIKAISSEVGEISPGGTTSVLKGKDITYSIKVPSNYSLADVKVDGNSVGKVQSYTFTNVSSDHTIQAEYSISLPFTDVTDDDWFSDEVAYCYSHNLFNGISGTLFAPNAVMTRGMVITVLGRFDGMSTFLSNMTGTYGVTVSDYINIRSGVGTNYSVVGNVADIGTNLDVLGSQKDSSGTIWYKVHCGSLTGWMCSYAGEQLVSAYDNKFKDISGKYFDSYVQWANVRGIIKGTSSTTFSPDAGITREDLCVILYNYLTNYCGKSISKASCSYTDSNAISSYATDAVNALSNIGVITGYSDKSFKPKKVATRAEVATVFMRLDDYLN